MRRGEGDGGCHGRVSRFCVEEYVPICAIKGALSLLASTVLVALNAADVGLRGDVVATAPPIMSAVHAVTIEFFPFIMLQSFGRPSVIVQ